MGEAGAPFQIADYVRAPYASTAEVSQRASPRTNNILVVIDVVSIIEAHLFFAGSRH